MIETRYDTLEKDINLTVPTIFLAGPTVRGHQPHLASWRFEAIEIFKTKKFEGNLIIPEFPSVEVSDQHRYDIPVWEFYGLRNCGCIMFWIPRTKELIGLTTNHEHGYWLALNRDKVVYGHPKEAYRMSYLDIMWAEDWKLRYNNGDVPPIYTTLEKTIDTAISTAHLAFKGLL